MMNATHFRSIPSQSFAVTIAFLLLFFLLGCGGGSTNTTNNGGGTPTPIAVSITTQTASINPGDNYTFVASVTNTSNQSVAWTVSCAQGVNDCGAIGASTGIYAAPATVSTASTVTVKATSAADSSKSSSTTFQLTATAVSITTHPSTINAGLTYRFAATVTAANKSVNWSRTCYESVADCGSIAADGTYTTPASVTQQSQVIVKATSVADTSKTDSFTFSLLPPIAVALMPESVEIVSGFSYPFSATTQNDMQNVVTWSVNNIPGGNAQVGTITPVLDPHAPVSLIALYSAPATTPAGPVSVTVTSAVDTRKSANAAVTLIPNPHLNFTGDCAFLISGGTSLGLDGAGGILTLDGAGHATAKLDIHSGSFENTIITGLDMTGTYGFEGKDGGWATLTYSQSGQSVSMTFKFVMISDAAAKVIEFDGLDNATGTIEKQSSSLAGSLDGKHVFTLKGFKPNNNPTLNETFLVLGQFTGAAGHLTGTYDLATDTSPSHQSHTTTANAWYEVVGKTGTVNLGVKGGTSLQDSPDFFLYPVSANRALVMSKVAPILVGSIDKQSDDTFSNASLAGDWTYYYLKGVLSLSGATLGRFSSDGNGTSAPGCEDSTGGSSTASPMCYITNFNNYTITADGRGFAPSAQFAMPYPVSFYFVDSDHGYFATQNGLGEFFRREGAPFSNPSLYGNYTVAFTGTQDYFFNAKSSNQVGTATLDGNGNITLVTSWVDARNFSLLQGYTRTGTYAFDSDLYATGDRGVMAFGPDFQLLYYTVSPDKVLIIQYDYQDVSFGIMQRSVFSNPPE
jgi:hypothetical protein